MTKKNLAMMKKFFVNLFLPLFLVNMSVAQKNADCVKAKEICKKGTHEILKAEGEGKEKFEAFPTPCFMGGVGTENGNGEKNATWIKVKIAKSGSLKFTIRPMKFDDDLDFVVYKLSGGNCSDKKIIRCCASGDKDAYSYCMGPTGLRDGENDVMENPGCSGDNNGYLKPINAKEGDWFVILVSNVSSAGQGFSIRLYGTCMLPCDEEKKPKEEPQKAQKDEPTVAEPIATTAPTAPVKEDLQEIEGRKLTLKKTLTMQNRRISMKVWDNSIEDGDIISIYVNGKKKYSNIYLTTKPQEFLLDLQPGENTITAHAESFGKSEPNTAAIKVSDGKNEQLLTLSASKNQEEMIKIVVE
jgi:hypothetical protein